MALPSTSISFTHAKNERVFYEVSGRINREKMEIVSEIFRRILTPLYGSQEKALLQIRESNDRRCFLLYEGEVPVAVLVFKTVLSNEFAVYGVKDSVEIKSLFVDHSQENSGKGLGTELVSKVLSEVESMNMGHSGVHVTVSETKVESLTFFRKKGFQIVHSWKDRYIKGTIEYLLSCPRRIQFQGESIVAQLAQNFSQATISSSSGSSSLLRIINTHDGDIHILMPLSDGNFITGSKDNCIYKWNADGELLSLVDDVEPTYQTDRDWITAAVEINQQYWVSGKRNGEIALWRTTDEHVKNIKLEFPNRGPLYSDALNKRRVTCIAKGIDARNPTLFVGLPTHFQEYSLVEGRSVSSTVVHDNDWPYCISPIREDSLLMVIAGRVEEWKKTGRLWNKSSMVMSEGRKVKLPEGKPQRPFISSLKVFGGTNGTFTLSDFTGAVKVLDLASKKIVHEWREHQRRVWTTEPLTVNTFASSGEDGLVKIWDVREAKSVRTISEPNQLRQVNALMKLKEHLLVAGTGTGSEAAEPDKHAQLRFYDLRKN